MSQLLCIYKSLRKQLLSRIDKGKVIHEALGSEYRNGIGI